MSGKLKASDYPPDWKQIANRVKFERAGGRCECSGECGIDHDGRCPRVHGGETSNPAYRVVLTTAHLWQGPCAEHHKAGIKCGDGSHLKAMCNGCHLRMDMPHHLANARTTRAQKKDAQRLLLQEE